MADPDSVEIQPPTLEAAQIMFDIACNSDAVDTYPEYFYLTMYRDFAATSLIAQEQSRPIAYAIAYAKHEDPGVLFIWQIAAVTKSRSRGIARRLIRALIDNRVKAFALSRSLQWNQIGRAHV